METLCNVTLQGFTRHRSKLMALLFLVIEAISFVLDQIGGNQLGFLVASFVLSLFSFLMIGYIAMGSKTDFGSDHIMIELAFSVVQLIMTYLYLVLWIFRVKLKSNIASIFPLVLAGTILILAYRPEPVQDPTTNTLERDEEEGFAGIPVHQAHDVTTSDNLSRVNREEKIPDTRAFISPVDTSTVVHGTPDSRILLPVITQSSIMVIKEETAKITEQEEILEKSRPSLISSDTPMMSKDEKIAILTAKWSDVNEEIADPTAAPTTPAISFKTKLFSKLITTTDLEEELTVPTEAMEHFPIPKGREFVDLPVKDMEGEIQKFRLTIKPKSVLTEGWLEFVKSKALVQEDIVTFYKQQNEDSEEQYRVEIDSINN